MIYRLALIGFGTVGQALAEILLDKEERLKKEEGFEAVITAVSDKFKGALYHPEGLDLKQLLQAAREEGTLEAYPDTPGLVRGWDSLTAIRESNADTVVEVTYTDVETGQPAIDHHRAAFESGKHVVTTNKGPVASAYSDLSRLAEEKGVRWGFEGAVMSGTPSLRMPRVALAGNEITAVRGILNGTTNYILSQMELGKTLEEALREAQDKGYAEADPTSDLEGYDVLYKVMILAEVVMGTPLKREEIVRHGIRNLTLEDVQQARREGKRWKLLGEVRQGNGRLTASVQPVALPLSDPLAGIDGAVNAVTYECDLAGPITLAGAGAGPIETGFSLLIDLLNLSKGRP
ncbi:homoserine dehydrogenase [Marinithermofilum abyssi]|uniref:Homoserine dehydrogenase n=1 Tax=Marinithermofilum abyssi TaxID=1571185 RepID=A0A8J2VBU7_9BACL|nr:homoserine dehydrogenase [Marinithermofilum abyssi]GGE13678.1 homoserine dehydrogenase [Marinithermofilum abyssi]